jgi:SAM-dependent methyltransferase
MNLDEHNLTLVESPRQVDEENASFYNRFPYPWQPATFDYPDDPSLYTQLVNQNLGAYEHELIPAKADIWVAGCGTNQGVYTGLRFPGAKVIGSDLSANSLALSAKIAGQIGLRNLELREESINDCGYTECFDYVICTGVIHHNADPSETLKKIARTMKPSGILELMVYNRYARLLPQAFQKSIRLMFGGERKNGGAGSEVQYARKLMRGLRTRSLMLSFLDGLANIPEQDLADKLIQPVEHSYTVESLAEMADTCGLELLAPCPYSLHPQTGAPKWYVEFKDPELTIAFESLPDVTRWQVANLLMLDQSPMVWFYLRRKDSGGPPSSESLINERFLTAVFEPVKAGRRCYVRRPNGDYGLSPQEAPFQRGDPEGTEAKIYHAVDGVTPMRDIFRKLGMATRFYAVLKARVELSTTLCPYLRVVKKPN